MTRFKRVSCALALGFGAALAAGSVLAQDAAAPPAPEQALEKIEITGSLIKRIEGETALPVTVVSKEDIVKSGAVSVEQLMSQLPSLASAGNTTGAQAAGATTGGLSAISLRGLGSLRTLVLINGKRVAPYGIPGDSTSVDINSIPLAAIERIEILKEGASATYGSDAIAGVVNFILRDNYQGGEASASYGTSTRGGGATKSANIVYGFGDLAKDRYNVMLTANYTKEDELWGRDRAFASRGFGPLTDSTSSNTFPGNITIPHVGRVNPGFPNNCAPSSNDPNFVGDPVYSQCRFDPAPYVPIVPSAERANVFASLHYALTNELTAYGEISYNANKNSQLEQPSPVSSIFSLAPGNPLFNLSPYNNGDGTASSTILLSPNSPYYPFSYVAGALTAAGQPVPASNGAYPALDVRYRTFFNGGRGLDDNTQTPRLTLGIKGTVLGWDMDASLVHMANQITEKTTSGYFIQSQLLPILNGQNPSVGYVNLLYPAIGPAPSAAQIAAMQATTFNGTAFVNKTTLDDLNIHASRDIGTLPGGPLSVGVGAELRHEKFQEDPNNYLKVGDISGYGGNFLPVDVGRSVYAAFAEVDAPLFKFLEADASVRFDHYQQVGSKTTPKIGFRFQPVKELLVRASVGKGFRAPSLNDLYAPQTQTVTPVLTDPADCVGTVGLGCNVQVTALQGGNAKLQPETSTNVSYGIVFEPTKNISASIDFFNIEIKNVILSAGLDPTFVFNNLGTWGSLVTRGAADPTLPGHFVASSISEAGINVGADRVSGFDVDFKWAVPTGDMGTYTFTLNGTYFSKYMIQNPDHSYTDQIDVASQTISNGGVIPRWKHRAQVDWTKGSWDIFVAQNWQGTYLDEFADRQVGTYETYDMNIGYNGFKNWTLNFGGKNILDKDPPFTEAAGLVWFQSGYDPSYADPRGRFLYLTVGYKFK